ncbi:hypothetical protein [Microcoleus sp. FACHB-SPT15]|nr:hypothetical protein [Microcoleus sp. FACHB-SPT15]
MCFLPGIVNSDEFRISDRRLGYWNIEGDLLKAAALRDRISSI